MINHTNMKSIAVATIVSGFFLMGCESRSQSLDTNGQVMEEKVKETRRYVHAHGMPSNGKILMVVSSPAVSEQTGWPIGFWAAELTHPLHVFQEAGYEVELVSTEGGEVVMDSYSDPTDASGYAAHDVISRRCRTANVRKGA